jgi:hypothetical protein
MRIIDKNALMFHNCQTHETDSKDNYRASRLIATWIEARAAKA